MAVPRRLAHLIVLAVCLLATVALAAPLHARAQDRTPTPSAKELWKDYPLDQGKPAPAQSAEPSPARISSGTAPADDSGSGQTIPALLAPLFML